MAKGNYTVRRLAGKALPVALAIITAFVFWKTRGTGKAEEAGDAADDSMRYFMLRELVSAVTQQVSESFAPFVSFAEEDSGISFWLLKEQIGCLIPFYGYTDHILPEEEDSEESVREILLAEAEEGISEAGREEAEGLQPEGVDRSLAELLREENEAVLQQREEGTAFVPHERMEQVDLAALADYETLLGRFYTVDSNTMAGSDQLNVARFLEKDMRVSKEEPGPQILIYHTHSQESFVDSVPGDSATSIVGVGDRLTQILTEEYGYQVLHHTEAYDADTRNDAYSRALPGVEQVLRDNPTIQVIIDLHRDEMPEGTRLVTELDGRPTARFMFFNGLSRTKKTGNIAYLYNENLESNLAFSFQMQLKAAEYYPGLTRKIYLKGYRYNMHLRDRYLLVELGAQNNTVEEAMNACDPLAHILDMVLSGGE
ncbi:MAG: stage II sporulation protein P [Acetatifactor sp.]|nr:stage II sporulation protein P [Acetatifactor sp.]